MKNCNNERPKLWEFIKVGLINKEKIYYCNKSQYKCIESEKTKKTFQLLGYLTIGLFVVVMYPILKTINGLMKYLVFFVSFISVFLLFDFIHWRFAKFLPISDEVNTETKGN